MRNDTVVESGLHREEPTVVGRKPSKNPLNTLISFRIDDATTKALDAEVARELAEKPGLLLGRGDMVRILMSEALLARSKKPHRK